MNPNTVNVHSSVREIPKTPSLPPERVLVDMEEAKKLARYVSQYAACGGELERIAEHWRAHLGI